VKESEISFPQPGQDKTTGRGTLPNPVGTGVEQLPDPVGAVVGLQTTPIQIDDYSTPIPNVTGLLVFGVNDYTNERSFIINRGMIITVDPAFPISDEAAISSSIIARFATTQPDPLTEVVIRYLPLPLGAHPHEDRTVFFSIVTFNP
jgi:hypothetical protein